MKVAIVSMVKANIFGTNEVQIPRVNFQRDGHDFLAENRNKGFKETIKDRLEIGVPFSHDDTPVHYPSGDFEIFPLQVAKALKLLHKI